MDLSIIIISYNTKDYLKKCLTSVDEDLSQSTIKAEIIVVDNDSQDNSVKMVETKFPKVKLIKSKTNLGFGKANNLGAAKAKGKYLLFLNSDTQVGKNALSNMLSLAKDNNTDISSCRLLNTDGSIQPQGGFLPRLTNLALWMLFIDDIPLINRLFKRYQESRISFFESDQHMGWLSGTALLVKRISWQKLGGFDENIFMYGEDVDFCYQAKKRHMIIQYFNQPQITHHGQKSGSSEGAVLGEYKGLLYVFKKHKSAWEMLFLKLLLKTGAILRIIIFGIIRADVQKKKIYQKAFNLV